MPEDWSREEVEAVVADYLVMLSMELRGEPFNKADRNRRLRLLIPARSTGSIEWKHQNISAALVEFGLPYVSGYKPRFNYQKSLLPLVIDEHLRGAQKLFEAADSAVEEPVTEMPHVPDILSVQVPPPHRERETSVACDEPAAERTAVRRNYLEIEARNRSLGLAGEQFILHFEHKRLWTAGQKALADRIEHVSRTRGDHLGFDIHSFENDGRDRLIEVKTTRFGALTPLFASRNEVEVSRAQEQSFYLYRLFSFRTQPRLFVLPGSLELSCELRSVSFSAIPR